MSEVPRAKRWRRTRICLRCCHWVILLLILLAAAIALYLNEVGLPGPLKRQLVDQLRSRGVNLQFSRLRWRFYRGIVAENVRFGSALPASGVPQLSIKEVDLKLNYAKLARLKFLVDSLRMYNGQLVWPIEKTNHTLNSLSVTNIQTQLRLLPGDLWELDHFTAAFAGARLSLSGSVTNASALRDWSIFHVHANPKPELLSLRLRQWADAIERIKFTTPPELNIAIHGDARDLPSFRGLITLETMGASTPWGTLSNGILVARLSAATASPRLLQADCQLRADEVETPWGGTRHFQLSLHASHDEILTNLVRARLEVSADRVATRWAQATNAQFTARWTHSLTNAIPLEGSEELRVNGAWTRWGSIGALRLQAGLTTPTTNGAVQADASWGWWGGLKPYFLNWNCRLENIKAEDFASQLVVCGGDWRAPFLTVSNLHTEMYQGHFSGDASLNVETRLANFICVSDFDVQKAVPFLTAGGRDWFERQQFGWDTPPLIHVTGSVLLPPWTDQRPDWKADVLPSLLLEGDFKTGKASYRRAPVTSAQSHVTFSNMTWHLPDLRATRPEGDIALELIANDRTKDFYFRIRSHIFPGCLRESIEPAARRVLDTFVVEYPPLVEAEIWGRGWHDYSKLGARAIVTASNFTFRGSSATFAHGILQYTNKFLLLTDARLERTNQYMTASAIGFDFDGKRAFLTNGVSKVDAEPVMRAIGPKVAKDVEPYHFLLPPNVSAYGVIPLSDDISVADLHFNVDGGPFEWMKFLLPHVSGLVNWKGESMTLEGVSGSFYGGKITGSAAFDFKRKIGTDFSFDTTVTAANLQELMADITTKTNQFGGTFDAHLNITRASSPDPKSWFGKGQVDLRDGLIWDIPIFGIFSSVLEKISPGLGKSRIGRAAGTFTITNSVIRSDDLDLRSSTVRLAYKGTVDFDLNVNATVEAYVGRDMPLLGPLVALVISPFTKFFESRVSGTLTNPKQTPEFLVTKMISPFLHPFRTLKDLFPGESGVETNAPPAWPVERTP